jgi:hypothetical protein
MKGAESANRGEARGEVKGDAFEDLVRNTAEDEAASPGGGCNLGEDCDGVGVRVACHIAGEGLRITVCLEGGGEAAYPEEALRKRQRASRTVRSSSLPVRVVSDLTTSSIFSTLSSSSSDLS